jgi:hypothetical protein
MRAALLVIAALALIGFVAVSWVLPGVAGSKAKEAATALVAGTEPLRQQVGAAAEGADAKGCELRRAQVDRRAERRDPRLERRERDRDLGHAGAAGRQGELGLPWLSERLDARYLRRPGVMAVRIPCSIALGVGGQPGTATSTGITLATRPRLA